MYKKIIGLVILVGLIGILPFSTPKPATYTTDTLWEVLENTRITYKYSADNRKFVPEINAGQNVFNYHNTYVTFKAFKVNPTETNGKLVLTSHPSDVCATCADHGIQTQICIEPDTAFLRQFQLLPVKAYVSVSGYFMLNQNNKYVFSLTKARINNIISINNDK